MPKTIRDVTLRACIEYQEIARHHAMFAMAFSEHAEIIKHQTMAMHAAVGAMSGLKLLIGVS